MESELGTALMAPLWMLLSFVALGVVCARRLAIDPRPIATLLIYVIAPLTFFRGLNLGGPTPDYLLLTLGLFLVSSMICLLAHRLTRSLFPPQEAAVVAFSAGTGNTGYFGLPVAMILLPPQGVTLYLFCILGITLYEFTLGFYISARGQFSIRQSLIRIARLPLVYAFLAALLVEAANLTLPPIVHQGLDVFPPAYTLLGMMIIGMTLGRVTLKELDPRFIAACALIRYVFWPLTSLLIVFGLSLLMPVTPELGMALLLLGVVPMAANVVVVAMELDIAPEKGAIAVLLTTLAAPLLIPFYLSVLTRLTGLG